jgi:hypothetical protein
MAAIKYDDWGVAVIDDLKRWDFRVPAAPACRRWQDEDGADTDMRLRFRCYYETTETAKYHVTGKVETEGPAAGYGDPLDALGPTWSEDLDAAVTTTDHPEDRRETNEEPDDITIPWYHGYVQVYPDSAAVGTAIVYGLEVSAAHDLAYDGRDVELFDWTGQPSISSDDCAAASCILTRGVVDANNRIIYDCGWMIGVVLCDYWGPGGPV